MNRIKMWLAIGAVAGLVVGRAVAGTWVSGSFLPLTNMALGDGTVSNAFKLAGGGTTTNLTATNFVAVNISGAGQISVLMDWISSDLAGTTNNGIVRFTYGLSQDGVTYTSGSNGFSFDWTSPGTTRAVVVTNIPTSVTTGWGYTRLQTIATTNIGTYFLTNLTYRFLRTDP